MAILSARDCSLTIWNAGVNAVRAEQLVSANVELRSQALSICHVEYPIDDVGKICIVGAGKAAGYLAAAIEGLLDPVADQLRLHGCVNVPANCLPTTKRIELHAGRPANVNEPTAEGVAGTKKILELVSSLESNDLCLCLLTGGGSALLPAPAPGISLEDKLSVTRLLSSNGASIQQLNRVRTAMSSIKGGGLSRACTAGKLVSLIVSDVIGDPLDLIASGPTVCDGTGGERAVDILRRFVSDSDLSLRLWRFFQDLPAGTMGSHDISSYVRNHLLANNMSAVNAAADQARSMGLSVDVLPPEPANASAEDVARTALGLVSWKMSDRRAGTGSGSFHSRLCGLRRLSRLFALALAFNRPKVFTTDVR